MVAVLVDLKNRNLRGGIVKYNFMNTELFSEYDAHFNYSRCNETQKF